MSSKSTSGEPTEYDARDEANVYHAVDHAYSEYRGDGTPSKMQVTAQVEWSGSVDRARGGMRRVRLDNLDPGKMRAVKAAVRREREAQDRARTARPSTSYTAQGWRAQLNALLTDRRGEAVSDRAGLSPTARTLRAWLSDERAPSRANQERIAQAYGGLRTWRVDQARSDAQTARGATAKALTDALRDRYGAEIRLRNIVRMTLDD